MEVLWPPIEYSRVAKDLRSKEIPAVDEATRWLENQQKEALAKLEEDAVGEEGLSLLAELETSERNRRDSIESKATSFLGSLSIASSILVAVPLLFSDRWLLPAAVLLPVAILYLLALLYFLTACRFALEVRRCGPTALPSADEVESAIVQGKSNARYRVSSGLSRARFNERILTLKANGLYVSEEMFKRGLILILVISVTLAGFQIISVSLTKFS